MITVQVRLEDDQLAKLAELIAERAGNNRRPLTVPQAAERLGLCGRTIRRRIEAGEIARVPLCGAGSRVLIPASEIDRLLNPQTEA